MIVRHIKTRVVPVLDEKKNQVVKDGQLVTKVVPELDANGQEIVLWSVDVPQAVEAAGGDAIDEYVTEQLTKPSTEETE